MGVLLDLPIRGPALLPGDSRMFSRSNLAARAILVTLAWTPGVHERPINIIGLAGLPNGLVGRN